MKAKLLLRISVAMSDYRQEMSLRRHRPTDSWHPEQGLLHCKQDWLERIQETLEQSHNQGFGHQEECALGSVLH